MNEKMKKTALSLVPTVFCASCAVAADVRVGIVDQCSDAKEAVSRQYVDYVKGAGFEPVVLEYTDDKAKIAEMVSRCDAIVFCGGEDVDPARYGEKPSPKLGKVNKRRDAWEWAVLDAAVPHRKPILGICRGAQLVNVYFGGTLWQDLPSEFDGCAKEGHRLGDGGEHAIKLEPDSRIAGYLGRTKLSVNSRHHQAVRKLGRGFTVAARSPDGVVEAIESSEYPAIGVQFHAESLFCGKGAAEFANLIPRPRIRTGLYCDKGSRGKNVVYWAKILSGSPDIDVAFLDGKDLRDGKLEGLDILVMPGGTGFGQYDSMLEEGAAKVREYLRAGGKYFGTCAGMSVLMNEEKRIAILPIKRIDGHYMRGGGDLRVKFDEKWVRELSLTNDVYSIQFHHGPVPVPGDPISGVELENIGISLNAIDQYGKVEASRRDAMIGTAAFVYATVDKGEVIACNCHPEGIPRTRDIVAGVFQRLTGRRIVIPRFRQFSSKYQFKATGRDSVLKALRDLNAMQ